MNMARIATRRNATYLLMALAMVYALLAGLRTVADFDNGWQLATGRWVAQHRTVFSTDVFSYTARGNPWIYPSLSGVIFYLLFLIGGYSALSWLNALACAATIALTLRRNQPVTALLAILAVPSVAFRTLPRADLFSTVLFAAVLRLLWQYRETGRARLWLLPLLMALWVNLHLGFVSGLGLFAIYTFAEIADMALFARRRAAWERLKKALPWMAAGVAATLLNPWGLGIYRALKPLNADMQSYSYMVTEWASQRITPAIFGEALRSRDPNSQVLWLIAIAIVFFVVALWRLRLGEAVFLGGAVYVAMHHLRMQALFAIVVIVVGGAVLSDRSQDAVTEPDGEHPSRLLWVAAAFALLLITIRTVDLVTDRSYLANGELSLFGAGRSWWLPERATEFIRSNHLPGNVMGTYNLGGYLVWKLDPEYPDYIDGRAFPFGPALIRRQNELLQSPVDVAEWQAEADRWKINTLIFSTARYSGLNFPLQPDCSSEKWKVVYLDDAAMILVRNTPANSAIVQRFTIDCAHVNFTPPPEANGSSFRARAERYNFDANVGPILYLLSRDEEALAAYQDALSIFQGDANLHLSLGQLYQSQGDVKRAEEEYRRSIKLRPTELGWYALARLLGSEQRYEEAASAVQKSAEYAIDPTARFKTLAQLELKLHRPKDALRWFDEAQKSATSDELNEEFTAQTSEGKAVAYRALGDLATAIVQQQQAVNASPKNASRWQVLADLYEEQGNKPKAIEAAAEANALRTAPPSP